MPKPKKLSSIKTDSWYIPVFLCCLRSDEQTCPEMPVAVHGKKLCCEHRFQPAYVSACENRLLGQHINNAFEDAGYSLKYASIWRDS